MTLSTRIKTAAMLLQGVPRPRSMATHDGGTTTPNCYNKSWGTPARSSFRTCKNMVT